MKQSLKVGAAAIALCCALAVCACVTLTALSWIRAHVKSLTGSLISDVTGLKLPEGGYSVLVVGQTSISISTSESKEVYFNVKPSDDRMSGEVRRMVFNSDLPVRLVLPDGVDFTVSADTGGVVIRDATLDEVVVESGGDVLIAGVSFESLSVATVSSSVTLSDVAVEISFTCRTVSGSVVADISSVRADVSVNNSRGRTVLELDGFLGCDVTSEQGNVELLLPGTLPFVIRGVLPRLTCRDFDLLVLAGGGLEHAVEDSAYPPSSIVLHLGDESNVTLIQTGASPQAPDGDPVTTAPDQN